MYQRTHSAMLLSVVYLVSFGVAGFLAPFAGWLADRVDRRRLVIVCELASAAAFAAALATAAVMLPGLRALRAERSAVVAEGAGLEVG